GYPGGRLPSLRSQSIERIAGEFTALSTPDRRGRQIYDRRTSATRPGRRGDLGRVIVGQQSPFVVAGGVHHPESGWPRTTAVRALADERDAVTVRRPARVLVVRGVVGELPQVLPVGIDCEDVEVPACGRGRQPSTKGDLCAVRREHGIGIGADR